MEDDHAALALNHVAIAYARSPGGYYLPITGSMNYTLLLVWKLHRCVPSLSQKDSVTLREPFEKPCYPCFKVFGWFMLAGHHLLFPVHGVSLIAHRMAMTTWRTA